MILPLAAKLNALFRRVLAAEDKPFTLFIYTTGVVVALFQFWNFLDTQKVETSFRHVEEWEDNGYKDAFDRTSDFIRVTEIAALSRMPADLLSEMSQDDKDLAKMNVTRKELATSATSQRDLNKLIYFFDKIAICSQRELCDADLLEEFFKDNLIRLERYARTYISRERDEIAGFGELTQEYVAGLKIEKRLIRKYWPF